MTPSRSAGALSSSQNRPQRNSAGHDTSNGDGDSDGEWSGDNFRRGGGGGGGTNRHMFSVTGSGHASSLGGSSLMRPSSASRRSSSPQIFAVSPLSPSFSSPNLQVFGNGNDNGNGGNGGIESIRRSGVFSFDGANAPVHITPSSSAPPFSLSRSHSHSHLPLSSPSSPPSASYNHHHPYALSPPTPSPSPLHANPWLAASPLRPRPASATGSSAAAKLTDDRADVQFPMYRQAASPGGGRVRPYADFLPYFLPCLRVCVLVCFEFEQRDFYRLDF